MVGQTLIEMKFDFSQNKGNILFEWFRLQTSIGMKLGVVTIPVGILILRNLDLVWAPHAPWSTDSLLIAEYYLLLELFICCPVIIIELIIHKSRSIILICHTNQSFFYDVGILEFFDPNRTNPPGGAQ